MDPDTQKMISFVDQIQAALKEVFKERGYDVNVGIPKSMNKGDDEGMGFTFNGKGELDQELVDSVVEEAITRVGGNMKGGRLYFDDDDWKSI